MANVPDIIDDLGGASAIADATGIPMTTVHSWKRAQFVPAWRVPALVTLSKKLGKPYRDADFPNERPARKPATSEARSAA